MLRLAATAANWTSRTLSCSASLIAPSKLNRVGMPVETIPEWRDEMVDIGHTQGRVDVRSQMFKHQTRKMGAQRRTRVQIVDNSKYASQQMYREPEFVISYRKRECKLS